LLLQHRMFVAQALDKFGGIPAFCGCKGHRDFLM
jgi:hypothetical protein